MLGRLHQSTVSHTMEFRPMNRLVAQVHMVKMAAYDWTLPQSQVHGTWQKATKKRTRRVKESYEDRQCHVGRPGN